MSSNLGSLQRPRRSAHVVRTVEQEDEMQINQRDNVSRVALGADHGGFPAKQTLKQYLLSLGYIVEDLGTDTPDRVDYPDIAIKVADAVASGQCDRGIMIDGAGIGSSMVCNKVRGIRAALCYDVKTAVNSREHNNANILALGGPLHSPDQICEIAKVWLETRFGGGRHWPRVNKIMAVEKRRPGQRPQNSV